MDGVRWQNLQYINDVWFFACGISNIIGAPLRKRNDVAKSTPLPRTIDPKYDNSCIGVWIMTTEYDKDLHRYISIIKSNEYSSEFKRNTANIPSYMQCAVEKYLQSLQCDEMEIET